ncbi:MAG: DinB family protein, partial [Acidobacteriia bacterium]|nr:DinB family protein [Terriglobia bacterium]
NYMFLRMLGVPPPPGVDPKEIMSATKDKPKTVQALKDSFAFMQKSIAAVSDADLDKPVNFFGQQTTQRGLLFHIAAHLGEHLGQSIAYARMTGVVPPWTAEQQKKEQEKPQHQHDEQP